MRAWILAVVVGSGMAPAAAHADDADKVAAAREAVADLLDSSREAFATCYDTSVKHGRLVSDATFYFEVGRRGRPTDVRVKLPGYTSRTLSRCLSDTLKTLRFPAGASSIQVEHHLLVADPS